MLTLPPHPQHAQTSYAQAVSVGAQELLSREVEGPLTAHAFLAAETNDPQLAEWALELGASTLMVGWVGGCVCVGGGKVRRYDFDFASAESFGDIAGSVVKCVAPRCGEMSLISALMYLCQTAQGDCITSHQHGCRARTDCWWWLPVMGTTAQW